MSCSAVENRCERVSQLVAEHSHELVLVAIGFHGRFIRADAPQCLRDLARDGEEDLSFSVVECFWLRKSEDERAQHPVAVQQRKCGHSLLGRLPKDRLSGPQDLVYRCRCIGRRGRGKLTRRVSDGRDQLHCAVLSRPKPHLDIRCAEPRRDVAEGDARDVLLGHRARQGGRCALEVSRPFCGLASYQPRLLGFAVQTSALYSRRSDLRQLYYHRLVLGVEVALILVGELQNSDVAAARVDEGRGEPAA